MSELEEYRESLSVAEGVMNAGRYNEIDFFRMWRSFNRLIAYCEGLERAMDEQKAMTEEAKLMYRDAVLDKREFRLALEQHRRAAE